MDSEYQTKLAWNEAEEYWIAKLYRRTGSSPRWEFIDELCVPDNPTRTDKPAYHAEQRINQGMARARADDRRAREKDRQAFYSTEDAGVF